MPETNDIAIVETRRARGRPKAEDLAELEIRLVRVARQFFLDKGYGATSMNEIAKAARVSKGTLYARFPSKADLFRGIIDEQLQSMGGRVVLVGAKPKNLEAMLRLYAVNSLRESLHTDVLRLNRLIYSEAIRFPELGDAAWARTRAGVRHVSDIIREYADLESIPCKRPEAAAETFTTILRGMYGDLMLRGRIASEAEIRSATRSILAIFLAGRKDW